MAWWLACWTEGVDADLETERSKTNQTWCGHTRAHRAHFFPQQPGLLSETCKHARSTKANQLLHTTTTL